MRAMWSGTISFGLVSIPVGIYAALDAGKHVAFRQLHRTDKAPIRYKKFCSKEDVEVPADEIVRGYEVSKGKFSIVESEELDEVQEEVGEGDRAIEIVQFVEPSSLNPLLFEKPYWLAPQKGGEKAYGLLRAAMLETRRVGIARFYLRTRPLLAALMPGKQALSLEVMRNAEELRDPSDLTLPSASSVKAPELAMARTLIEQMSAEWDPTEHPNTYRKALEKLLAKKRVFELEAPDTEDKPKARGKKVVDLMAVLQQSLDRPARTKDARGRRAATTKRRRGAA
ncbi:MAG TPA: Ku protein [Candidatus Binatia bacterium]|nr:Ku protein [Candidatus Binatia bacterium]